LLGALGAGCREVGAGVASRAVEGKAAAQPLNPRSQKREGCDRRHIRPAAMNVCLMQERRPIAQYVGAKSYQGLTQPADRSLNPDAPRGDQRANGAADKGDEPNGQRHDHGKDHGSDARCSPPGSWARRRPHRPPADSGQSCVRPLSAGAALYARPRTEVACQAWPGAHTRGGCRGGLGSLRVRGPRALRSARPAIRARAANATPLGANCDLIASILNPNRSFSATLSHKTEITGEFVLAFNKFGETITGKGVLRAIKAERKRGTGYDEKSTGGGHGKDNSKRCCAAHGTGRVGRSRRVRARSGQKPVRSIP